MAVRLSALRAGRPLPPGRFLILISVRGFLLSSSQINVHLPGGLFPSGFPANIWHTLLYKMYQGAGLGAIQWEEFVIRCPHPSLQLGTIILPSVATGMFVETLQHLQHTMRLDPEGLNYKLHTGHENLSIEIHSGLLSIMRYVDIIGHRLKTNCNFGKTKVTKHVWTLAGNKKKRRDKIACLGGTTGRRGRRWAATPSTVRYITLAIEYANTHGHAAGLFVTSHY
jgi:hypothetical protein